MDNKIKVMYLCDGKVPECPKTICYKKKRKTPEPACRHTGKIEHAVNFEMRRPESEYYFEKERHPKIAKVRDKIFHILSKREMRKKVIREKREIEKNRDARRHRGNKAKE